MLARLKENRDLCLDALRGIAGVTVPKPDGAFYLFPRIDGLRDSFDFCSGCWKRRGSDWRRAWRSERAEKVRSGFVTRRSGRFWSLPWNV